MAACKQIAIIGAGPVGLEAALRARKLGWSVTVHERGRVGEHLRRWGFVTPFRPFGCWTTPLGREVLKKADLPDDDQNVTGREIVTAYLEPLARGLGDTVCEQSLVLAVGRAKKFRLLIRSADGSERIEEADTVIDCTGRYGRPRRLGDGGIPAAGELGLAQKFANGLEDVAGEKKAHYADKTTLVVGGGYAAATNVLALAELAQRHSATWVVWLSRSRRSQPLPRIPNDPLPLRDRLAARANSLACRGEGHVEYHPGCVVERVEAAGEGFRVTARSPEGPRVWEVDRVIGNTGFAADDWMYPAGRPADLVLAGDRAGADCAADGYRHVEEFFSAFDPKSRGGRAGRWAEAA